jgi:hypothetical protein
VVDSSDSQAAVITGNGSVNTQEVDITGTSPGYSLSGNGQFVTSPNPGNINVGQSSTADPLAGITPPDPSTMVTQSSSALRVNSATVLAPGRYIGGIGISNGAVTLMPGVYYMDHGGFSISNGSVTGQNVMIYNDPDSGGSEKVDLTGGNFNLSAPVTGPYQGIVLFQARGAGGVRVSIAASVSSQMLGTVYAPSSPVDVAGSGGTIVGSLLIADTVKVTGSGDFNVDWNGSPPPAVSDIGLVE